MLRICYELLSFGYNYLSSTPTLKEEYVHAIMPYVGSGLFDQLVNTTLPICSEYAMTHLALVITTYVVHLH